MVDMVVTADLVEINIFFCVDLHPLTGKTGRSAAR